MNLCENQSECLFPVTDLSDNQHVHAFIYFFFDVGMNLSSGPSDLSLSAARHVFFFQPSVVGNGRSDGREHVLY